MSTVGCGNDLKQMHYLPSDILDTIPYKYFLKQSAFIVNCYLDAKNECLSILEEANEDILYSGKSQTENTNVPFNIPNIEINEPCDSVSSSITSFIKQGTPFCDTIVHHSRKSSAVPYWTRKSTNYAISSALYERSKFLRKSKHKRTIYFITKNIGFIVTDFTFNVQNIYLKLKEMNLSTSFITNLKSNQNCTEYSQDDKSVQKAPKVLVEKTSASNICFGNISALVDFNIENCYSQNPCHEMLNMTKKHDSSYDSEFESELDQENSSSLNMRSAPNEVISGSDNNSSRNSYFQSSNDDRMNYSRNKVVSKYAKMRSRKSYQNTAFYKLTKLLRKQNTYSENAVNKGRKNIIEDFTSIKKNLMEGKGPTATVLLNRLSDEYIQKATSVVDKVFRHVDESSAISGEIYHKPSYILRGIGLKLKDIPIVKDNVMGASARSIRFIHHILFGTVEKDHKNRLNILEFNGYSDCQNNFMEQMAVLLKRMYLRDIKVICKIFLIKTAGKNKPSLIKLLFQFLEAPSPHIRKRNANILKLKRPYKRLKNIKFKKQIAKSSIQQIAKPTPMPTKSSSEEIATEAFVLKPSLTLRNFERISFNVECAAPEDLTELNDLLFIKPIDPTEIHQQILDFTYFPFCENSIEYHYRKTLLHYMDVSILKKIALLLDIECGEGSNHQELSGLILKFLMEPKEISAKSKKERKSNTLFASTNQQTDNKPKFEEEKTQIVASKSELEKSPMQCSDHDYSFLCETNSTVNKKEITDKNKVPNCNVNQMSNVTEKKAKAVYLVKKTTTLQNSSATSSFRSILLPPSKVQKRKNSVFLIPSPVRKNGIVKVTNSPLITRVQAVQSN